MFAFQPLCHASKHSFVIAFVDKSFAVINLYHIFLPFSKKVLFFGCQKLQVLFNQLAALLYAVGAAERILRGVEYIIH